MRKLLSSEERLRKQHYHVFEEFPFKIKHQSWGEGGEVTATLLE